LAYIPSTSGNERISKLQIRIPCGFHQPYVEGWGTVLRDVAADASELYLTVGMMSPDTAAEFHMVNHQLARMDLRTGNILISHLKGTFF
jgi:hypothetical protein